MICSSSGVGLDSGSGTGSGVKSGPGSALLEDRMDLGLMYLFENCFCFKGNAMTLSPFCSIIRSIFPFSMGKCQHNSILFFTISEVVFLMLSREIFFFSGFGFFFADFGINF